MTLPVLLCYDVLLSIVPQQAHTSFNLFEMIWLPKLHTKEKPLHEVNRLTNILDEFVRGYNSSFTVSCITLIKLLQKTAFKSRFLILLVMTLC